MTGSFRRDLRDLLARARAALETAGDLDDGARLAVEARRLRRGAGQRRRPPAPPPPPPPAGPHRLPPHPGAGAVIVARWRRRPRLLLPRRQG